ncbi:unnamed protein product [Cyprideis torosa]|uniref:Uncharacterized protein n=1 Tax=Cyprideis torosa TaxID=163714 RepID=A0A7R8ZN73_9CRUS|nr:unnamed protein product [Cyprideis torosa]CAG0890847.1 unnamed protein product [Cyprideis torosa]
MLMALISLVRSRRIPGETRHERLIEAQERSKLKVIKMFVLVVISFSLSWLPLYVIFTRIKFGSEHMEVWEHKSDWVPCDKIICFLCSDSSRASISIFQRRRSSFLPSVGSSIRSQIMRRFSEQERGSAAANAKNIGFHRNLSMDTAVDLERNRERALATSSNSPAFPTVRSQPKMDAAYRRRMLAESRTRGAAATGSTSTTTLLSSLTIGSSSSSVPDHNGLSSDFQRPRGRAPGIFRSKAICISFEEDPPDGAQEEKGISVDQFPENQHCLKSDVNEI